MWHFGSNSGTCLGAVLALALAVEPPCAAVQAEFHMAPTGSDLGTGTARLPFATFARARQEVRRVKMAGQSGDIIVWVHGGTYYQASTLTFGSEDGGTSSYAVKYKAFGDGEPIVSGGMELRGFVEGADGLWSVTLPRQDSATPYFRQLFVNGIRAVRAREPDRSGSGDYAYRLLPGSGENTSVVPYTPTRPDETWIKQTHSEMKAVFESGIVKAWSETADVEVFSLNIWSSTRKRVKNVSLSNNTLYLAPPHGGVGMSSLGNGSKVCWLENAREFLDEPGEWYLSRASGVLSYKPRPGEQILTTRIIAPRLSRLVAIEGIRGKPVRNLHFEGITFAHTNEPLPSWGDPGRQAATWYCRIPQWMESVPLDALRRGAGIVCNFMESCSFTKGQITAMGGSGIDLHKGCHNNTISRNGISQIGANGICIGSHVDPVTGVYCPGTGSDDRISGAGYLTIEDVATGNTVSDNVISLCAQDYWGAHAIWVAIARSSLIEHNDIHDLPYSGISVGWCWGEMKTAVERNIVRNNDIHHVLSELGDGGAIYTLGRQPGTVLEGNYIHDCPKGRYCSYANGSIFFDQGSSGETGIEGPTAFVARDNVLTFAIRKNQAGALVLARNVASDPGIEAKAGVRPEVMPVAGRNHISGYSGNDDISFRWKGNSVEVSFREPAARTLRCFDARGRLRYTVLSTGPTLRYRANRPRGIELLRIDGPEGSRTVAVPGAFGRR